MDEENKALELLVECHLAFNLGRAIDQSALRDRIEKFVVENYHGPKRWLFDGDKR